MEQMDFDGSSRDLPAVPEEFAGPLPRKVRLYSTDGRNLFAIAVLFLICGAIFTVSYCSEAIKQTRQRAVLRANGSNVVGEVTGFSIGRWAPTVVKYRFVVNGVTYSGRAKEPRNPGPGTALNESDQLLVRYLPSDPEINHPDAWEWSALMGLDSIVFQAFLVTMSILTLTILFRDRKLARDGKAAPGVVTSCTPKDRQFQVEYEFRREDGVLMRGKSGSHDPYQAGARIWILYLPQSPNRNRGYPLPFFEVADQ